MGILSGEEEKKALEYMNKAGKIALNSTCQNSKCGSVIVNKNEIIGSGFNSPPKNKDNQRRCSFPKSSYHQKVNDKTCCIHAEQRAVNDALTNNSNKINGSRLYFVRLKDGEVVSKSGKPYCTHCSKLALDVGIKEFVLWHDEGLTVYDTEDYNKISFEYSD